MVDEKLVADFNKSGSKKESYLKNCRGGPSVTRILKPGKKRVPRNLRKLKLHQSTQQSQIPTLTCSQEKKLC